jgi:hypothetical protein
MKLLQEVDRKVFLQHQFDRAAFKTRVTISFKIKPLCLGLKTFNRLPAGVTGIHLVPEGNIPLPMHPAQVDFSSLS